MSISVKDNAGVFKKTATFVPLVTLLFFLAAASAGAAEYFISDQNSCETLPAGANWSVPSTCTLVDDLSLEASDTLTIPAGSELVVPESRTLHNDGNLLNEGMIEVYGVLNNYGTIDSTGELANYGFLFNYGDMVNGGSIYNEGTITIGPDGNLEGSGTFEDNSNPFCPPGSTYDDSSDLCVATPVYTCPDGTTLEEDKCVAEVQKCPKGADLFFDLSDGQWKCIADPGLSCPDITYFSDGSTCYSVKSCPPESPKELLMKDCQISPECSDEKYEFRGDDCALGDPYACPEGSTYKGGFHIPGVIHIEGNCVLDEIPECSDNGEARGDYCYHDPISVECPPDTSFDGVTCTATPECPSGMDLIGGVCQKKPTLTCPAGTSLTDITLLCEATPSCPSGYSYKLLTNDCRKTPECSGSTYNAVLELCQRNATKTCPEGSELNDLGFCQKLPPCNDGFTNWGVYCSKDATLSCPSGYERNGSKCYKFPSCSGGIYLGGVCQASLDCPDGTVLLPGGLCEGTPDWSCSAGSLDATGVWCTADSTCPEYTLNDYVSGTCWSVPIDTNCPDGYEFHTLSGKCRKSICPDPYKREFGECKVSCQTPEDILQPCPKGFTLDWENEECTRGISLELDPCPSGSVFDRDRVLCVADMDVSIFKCPEDWELVRKQTFINSFTFYCEREPKCSGGFDENTDNGLCEADLQLCPEGLDLAGPFCVGDTREKCPAGTEVVADMCEGNPQLSCPPGTVSPDSGADQCLGPKLTQCPPGTYIDNGICLFAPAGTFTASSASITVTVCPASRYCPEGSASPIPCPPGTTAPEGSFSPDQCLPDIDGDTIGDGIDNCPAVANADQLDTDEDSFGNLCDEDDDNDRQTDIDEIACGSDPLDKASLSPDFDGDFSPDCVDSDDDNDGILDMHDACPFEDPSGFDADSDGCTDNFAGLTGLVGSLAQEGTISQNLAGPLLAKVEAAEKSVSKDNVCAAVNQTGAFKNQIEAKRGNPLSDEMADQLILYADNIITQLLSTLPPGETCE